MGRDTYIKLRGHLEPEQILNVVKYTIDREAKIDMLTTTKYTWRLLQLVIFVLLIKMKSLLHSIIMMVKNRIF